MYLSGYVTPHCAISLISLISCPIRPLCSKKCPTYTAHGPCTYQFLDQHHTGTENFTATHMHHRQ